MSKIIYDLDEYTSTYIKVQIDLEALLVYRIANQEVKGIDDIENIKCTFDNYQRLTNMIESVFENPTFKSVYGDEND